MPSNRYLWPLLVAALTCYPIYGALVLGADTVCGTRQLLTWISFESKHALVQRELLDIFASIGIALPAVLITTLIALAVRHKSGALPGLAALAVIALVIALFLTRFGFAPAQTILFTAALLLSTLAALLCARIFNHATH